MKYRRLSEDAAVPEAAPPSDRKIAMLKNLLEEMGCRLRLH
jgi:hypothetical protein